MNEKNKYSEAKGLMYTGFTLLGAVLCGIYGFTANRFNLNEIFFLILGGAIVGVAVALICNGIIEFIRK